MLVMLALTVLRPAGRGQSDPSATTAPIGTAPDISNMTPAERALALFNRVMTASESGNVAEVQQFLPMAIAAHDMARPLTVDQLYHLALLHKAGGDHASALAISREALAQDSLNLLPLMAAADAARALGDQETARLHAAKFLEVYQGQRARNLDDYTQHARQLEAFQQTARGITGR
jgi:hypothetical protein